MHRLLTVFLLVVAQPAAAQAVVEQEDERRTALEREIAHAERDYRAIDESLPIVGQTAGGVMLGGSVVVFLGFAMWEDDGRLIGGMEADRTARDWAFGVSAGVALAGIVLLLACVIVRHDLDRQRTALRLRIDDLRGELAFAF